MSLLLLLTIVNTVGAVIINPDVLILANGYTMHTITAQNFSYMNIETNYTQLSWEYITTHPTKTTSAYIPNAPGTYANFNPSAGANWQCVDETIHDMDATYVQTGSAAIKYDTYNIPDHTTETDPINFVTVTVSAKKTGADANKIWCVVNPAPGPNSMSGVFNPTATYVNYSYNWLTNPNTGVAWIWPDIDTLQIGVKSDDASVFSLTYVTQVYMTINYTDTVYISGYLHNITYVSNVTSSHSLVEQTGMYGIGNYTTDINIDVYKTSTWTINNLWIRIKDALGTQVENISGSGPTHYHFVDNVPDGSHRRYTYVYNPSNSIPDANLGWFDIDVLIDASNATLHYYGNHSWNNLFEVYELDPPWNIASPYNITWNSVNMTWNEGNNSDRTVIVRKNASYPSSPLDPLGYEVYNGTETWHNETNVLTTRYYTIYSYNATSHSYAAGVNMEWGLLGLSVYNESSPWIPIWFNIIISDQAGTDTYTATNIPTTTYLDVLNIPFGVNTIIVISNSSYRTCTYTKNILANKFTNLTFYIPPILGEETGTTPEENATTLYLLTVINPNNQPIPDALVVIKRYINTTDSYEEVRSMLTDGNGQIDVYLVPQTLYKVFINATGYKQEIADYIPSTEIFTHTFMLEYEDVIPPPGYVYAEEITFNGYIDRAAFILYLNFTDNLETTLTTDIQVWEINQTGSRVLFSTDYRYAEYTFQVVVNGINNSNVYEVILIHNSSTFGVQTTTLIFDAEGFYTPPDIGGLLDFLIGTAPFAAPNLIMACIIIGIFYYTDSRDAGKFIIVGGVIMLFISYTLNIHNALNIAVGGSIPVLCIIIGILMEWGKK